MTNMRENEMFLGIGNTADMLHTTPSWARTPDDARADRLQSWLVGRRIAGWIAEASEDRLAPRGRRPLRLRVGRAITGLGERIAGYETRPRIA